MTVYYVDFEKKERECSICHEIKPFAAFTQTGKHYRTPKEWCRMCEHKLNYQRYLERKFLKLPGVYNKCECGFVYHTKYGKCPQCHREENFAVLTGGSDRLQCAACGEHKLIDAFPSMVFVKAPILCWQCKLDKIRVRKDGKIAYVTKEIITRSQNRVKCLNYEHCGVEFVPEGRFNRICPRCKEDNRHYMSASLLCSVPSEVYC